MSRSVSVLLVTKNGERYLAELLESVRAQQGNFRLDEIIAVDGAVEFSVREEQVDGLEVVQIVNNHSQTSAALRFSYDNSFCDAPFLRRLDRFHPEVVHFQHLAHLSVSLIPLAASLGYPTVLSLHDFFFSCHRIHLTRTPGFVLDRSEGSDVCHAWRGSLRQKKFAVVSRTWNTHSRRRR